MTTPDPFEILRTAPFGSTMSLLAHYGMYEQFARQLSWRGTLEIFDLTARLYVDDPKGASRPERIRWKERIKGDVRVLRCHGLFDDGASDDEIARDVIVMRERSNFQSILLHIYADDPDAMAEMVSHDPAELEAFERARSEGGVLIVGPHLGPFHGLVPLMTRRSTMGPVDEVMMYRSRAEWKLLCHAYERSGIPAKSKPTLVDPDTIFDRCVERLRANACVGMLSDSTQFGRRNGRFRGRVFGHEVYAPSGPIRIAHATGRPVFTIALVPRPDDGLHLHLREAYRPRAEPLDDATIQSALDYKWAQFEEYVRLAPLTWYPLGSLGLSTPPAQVPSAAQ